MKKILLIVLAMVFMALMANSVLAAPFLVCDSQTGVIVYKLTGPGWTPTSIPAETDGSLKLDLATSTIGLNSLTVAACIKDPIWGEACSAPVPFGFTRPAALPPENLTLVP